MRVVFRVDASTLMGHGHVMRCLTLADELRQQGVLSLFITRAFSGHLADQISDRGHDVVLLAFKVSSSCFNFDGHNRWLAVSWEQDAAETCGAIENERVDWLVIDHYGIDARWHHVLRKKAAKILVIDDLANRELDCDLLLDQTHGRLATDYNRQALEECRKLLGSEYALLRPEFMNRRTEAYAHRRNAENIKRVLVSLGGADSTSTTLIVLEGLLAVSWPDEKVHFDVVLGESAPCYAKVKQLIEQSRLSVALISYAEDMADLMLWADLAVGAGGTTSWERCCLGLPSLVVELAANQSLIINGLVESGAAVSLGRSANLTSDKVADCVTTVVDDVAALASMSQRCFEITDGNGVRLVANYMLDEA